MSALIALLVALARAFLPALLNQSPDTMEDATVNPELRNRLRRRIRATWPRKAVCIMLLLGAFSLPGCALRPIRTVYVRDGDPVRIRETIRDVPVWIMNDDCDPVPSVIDIPEGWYAVSLGDEDAAAENDTGEVRAVGPECTDGVCPVPK